MSPAQRGRDSPPPHWNHPQQNRGDSPSNRNPNQPSRGRESPSNRDPRQSQPAPQQVPPQYANNYPPPHHQQQQQPPPQQQQQPQAYQPYQHPSGPPQHQQQHPHQNQGDMVTLPPPPQVHQDMYRPQHAPAPAHYDLYAQQAPPPMNYGQQQPQQAAHQFNQPAPRQRTAIACRYCRRRKIRCHGFDQNPEGRCSNCVRFNQECIFTPVSSQTHAFVPAHTAYPHLRNQGHPHPPPVSNGHPIYSQQGGPPLYGAHGQPLGAPPSAHPDAHYPPPPNPHQPYGAPAPYPTAPPYNSQAPPHHAAPHNDQVSRKRQHISDDGAYAPPRLGIHIQLSPLSPPYSESPALHSAQNRRSSGYDHYPDPNHMTPISPASTTASYPNPQYQGGYYAQGQQPPPAQQPTPSTQHRTSPTSNYSYEAHRESASPHGSVNAGPGNSYGGPYHGHIHPPLVLPAANEARGPSPAGQARENGRPNGMRVHDMLDNRDGRDNRDNRDGRDNRDSRDGRDNRDNSDSQGGRSNTDSSMLSRLNRRAP